METNPNINRLLEMLDHPESYSEQEIRDIVNSDDETRRAYQLMVAAKQGFIHKKQEQPADVETAWQKFISEKGLEKSGKHSSLFKFAASFIGVILISGIAFAAFHFFSSTKEKQQSDVPALNSQPSTHNLPANRLVRFSDICLDSILYVVAAHYGKTVCFLDTAAKELRLSTIWDREDSLMAFITTLNEFDGLKLKDERDTIFVVTEAEEAK